MTTPAERTSLEPSRSPDAVKATRTGGGINVTVDGRSIRTKTTNPDRAAKVLREQGVSEDKIGEAAKQIQGFGAHKGQAATAETVDLSGKTAGEIFELEESGQISEEEAAAELTNRAGGGGSGGQSDGNKDGGEGGGNKGGGEEDGDQGNPAPSTVKATKSAGGINVVAGGKSIGTGTTNPTVAAQVLRDQGVSEQDIAEALKQVSPPPTPQEAALEQVNAALAAGASVGESALKAAGVAEAEVKRVLDQQAAFRQINAALASGAEVSGSALRAAGASEKAIKDFEEDRSDLRQVNAALKSGANVDASALRDAGVSETAIKQIQDQQQALRQVNAALTSGAAVSGKVLRLAGVPEEMIKGIEAQQSARGKLERIPGVVERVDGRKTYDLVAALAGGATPKNLEDAGFDKPAIDAAAAAGKAGATAPKGRPLDIASPAVSEEALDAALDANVSIKALREAGVTGKDLDAALRRQLDRDFAQQEFSARSAAAAELKDFLDEKGRVEGVRALRAGKSETTLRNYGLSTKEVSALQRLDSELKAMEKIKVDTPSDSLGREVKDILKEAFTFGKAETTTFNMADVRRDWIKAKDDLSAVYDKEEKAAAAKGERLITSKDDFIKSNIGTRKSYVNTVMSAQPALASVAKEFGLASVPVYGTIRTWDESPNWMRALSIASDLMFFVPIAGQVSGATRAGTSLARGSARVAVATVTGPVQAVRHPLRAAKAALEPFETALHPKKVPLASVEVRDATIRLPAVEGYTAVPGHTLTVPRSALQQLDPGTGLVSRSGKVQNVIDLKDLRGIPQEPALRGMMEWRDRVTLDAIKGRASTAAVPAGEGASFEGSILRPSAQGVIGPAAVHSTPDLRSFMLGTTVGGSKTGELFLAPGGMSRFIRSNATGIPPKLAPKVEEAVALGQISKNPVPGFLLIRDQALLQKLTTSNKLWRGAAEIERTLPVGTKIPAPSQFLFTRTTGGERATMAIIGDPLSPAEIAKLKFVGTADTVKSIFRRPGKVKVNDVTQAVAASDDAVDLLNKAAAAEARGAAGEASSFRLQAAAAQAKAEAHLVRAQGAAAAGLSSGKLRPVGIYTGAQDLLKGLRTLAKPGARSTKTALAQARRTGGVIKPSRSIELARGVGTAGKAGAGLLATGTRRRASAKRRDAGLGISSRSGARAGGGPSDARGGITGEQAKSSRPMAADGRPSSSRTASGARIMGTRTGIGPRTTASRRTGPARAGGPGAAPRKEGASRRDAGAKPAGRTDAPVAASPRSTAETTGRGFSRVPSPAAPETRRGAPSTRTPERGTTPGRQPPGGEGTPRQPPRFRLPGGKSLPRGSFPEVVQWPQGEFSIQFNLQTGKVVHRARKPDGTEPEDGLRVIRKNRVPPKARAFRMGAFEVVVAEDGLDFTRSTAALRGDRVLGRRQRLGRGARSLGRIRRGL